MTRADSVITMLALLLLAFLFQHYWSNTSAASRFQVINAQQQPQHFSLDQNKIHRISGKIGDSTIEVRDHKVRFVDSPCKAKLCVHSGWLTDAGDTAACLPNRVLIQIDGNSTYYDAINF